MRSSRNKVAKGWAQNHVKPLPACVGSIKFNQCQLCQKPGLPHAMLMFPSRAFKLTVEARRCSSGSKQLAHHKTGLHSIQNTMVSSMVPMHCTMLPLIIFWTSASRCFLASILPTFATTRFSGLSSCSCEKMMHWLQVVVQGSLLITPME